MFNCSIAHMYAQVIFDLAMKKKEFERWKIMLKFAIQIACHKKIRHCLSGVLSSQYTSQIFNVIGENIFNTEFQNLIKVIADNKRLNLLNNILHELIELKNNYENIIVAEITSYQQLNPDQLKNIYNFLKKTFNKKINLKCKIDDSIIDGFIIKVHDIVINMSIRNHLKKLETFLQY